MTTSSSSVIEDENAHVQELKKVRYYYYYSSANMFGALLLTFIVFEIGVPDRNSSFIFYFQLFLSCCINGEQVLNSSGLQALCEKLKLSEFGYEISERVLNGYKFVDFNVNLTN